MDTHIQKLFSNHNGAVRGSELSHAGLSAAAVRRLVKSGAFVKTASRGVYAVPGTSLWWIQARSRGADLACVSAAQAMGLWTLPRPGELHISHAGREFEAFGIWHRRRAPGLIPMLAQCCECLSELEALVVMESAVVQGLISYRELRVACTGRSKRFREVFSLVTPGAQSLIETVARYHLINAGHQVQTQAPIPGVGHADLMVDGVLAIEVDGYEFHSSRKEFAEDRRRNNEYVKRGIPFLRVTYADVVHEPVWFINQVETALSRHAR